MRAQIFLRLFFKITKNEKECNENSLIQRVSKYIGFEHFYKYELLFLSLKKIIWLSDIDRIS